MYYVFCEWLHLSMFHFWTKMFAKFSLFIRKSWTTCRGKLKKYSETKVTKQKIYNLCESQFLDYEVAKFERIRQILPLILYIICNFFNDSQNWLLHLTFWILRSESNSQIRIIKFELLQILWPLKGWNQCL